MFSSISRLSHFTHTHTTLRLFLLLNLSLQLLFGSGQLIFSPSTVIRVSNSREDPLFPSNSNLQCNCVRAVVVCVCVCVETVWFSVWYWGGYNRRESLCMGQTLLGTNMQHGAYLLFLHSLWMISPMLWAMMIYISSLIISRPHPLPSTSYHCRHKTYLLIEQPHDDTHVNRLMIKDLFPC